MKIIIEDKSGNYLCSFNVYNNHHYYDDDVEIDRDSLKDCNTSVDEKGNEIVKIQINK